MTIFRNLQQEAGYTSPYAEGGEVVADSEYSAMKQAHPRIETEIFRLLEEQGIDPEIFAANMMMGDLEFQADVAPYFGPFGQAENIDPSRARLIPGREPLYQKQGNSIGNLRGFYVPEGVPDDRIEDMQSLIDAYQRQEGVEPKYMPVIEPDTVYGVGAIGGHPSTWAHEFRHRTFDDLNLPGEENIVRMFDMLYETDPEEYEIASREFTGRSAPRRGSELHKAFLEGTGDEYDRILNLLNFKGKIEPNDLYPVEDVASIVEQIRAPENTYRGRRALEQLEAERRAAGGVGDAMGLIEAIQRAMQERKQ